MVGFCKSGHMYIHRFVWGTTVGKNYTITPNWEDVTVLIGRHSYASMASTTVDNVSVETITAPPKQINKEMDLVCSTKSDTNFSKDWDKVDFTWNRI